MKLSQICSHPALTVSASSPVSEVADLMARHRVGAIVVTSTPSVRPVAIGIVTDRDIVRAQLTRAADFSTIRTADVMTPDPLEICETQPIDEVIRRMHQHGVRRAVVISANGELRGVVSADDLIAELTMELVGLARVVATPRATA